MLSFGCMVERQSEPPKGEPAERRGVGSTRLNSRVRLHNADNEKNFPIFASTL